MSNDSGRGLEFHCNDSGRGLEFVSNDRGRRLGFVSNDSGRGQEQRQGGAKRVGGVQLQPVHITCSHCGKLCTSCLMSAPHRPLFSVT